MNTYHFEEHHLLLRDQVRRMAEKHVAPIASEIDETCRFPEELVEVFGDMGLLQLWVPQEYGGPGGDLTSVCLVKEEIAKISESAALLAANNSFGLILPVLNFGTEEQKRHYLGLAAKGRTLTAVAITEADTGSDVSSMKTRAVKDGASWVLNGAKIYITFGPVAHFILVFARTSEGRGTDGISAFLLDTSTKGFSVGKEDRKMGIRGVPNAPIFFDNVRIPEENMIGPEGQAFKTCMRILDLNRPTVGATAVGLAQGAIDHAARYARERKQFGRSISEFQGIQFMLADMQMQTEAARCMLYDCTRMADRQDWDGFSAKASMVKCFASDTAMKVTTDAVQIFGGAGYMRDFPIERYMRDAKINQIFEGTNQIQRLIIARHMLRH
ncbi:acyl-CoA dehydrogenase family protein [Bradyrhizobium sp. LHD-71]|uniref:acyl-CoA dehydrogenase family protein n=1 Tax=Bradyrhizobium sp. LHD-71 TaxID=3072141 RepID=UPI00280CE4AB|nr:acyl-CoA dehydrogenase family protein [Bradyrhizobium sp. LHD-71]MDQ8727103.1 acyl-CoA dehydrogenase family protein [Bradyrhizobium sp. LHD-71]